MIVYAAIHRASGRRYVGWSKHTLAHRRHGHESDARRGSQYAFHRALRKYGTDAFDWEVIAVRDTAAEAKEAEIYYIAFFRSDQECGYNETKGGEGFTGSHTPATRAKISAAHKGKPAHPNVVAALRARKGKPNHPNTREALLKSNKARKGEKASQATRAKISAGLLAYHEKRKQENTE